jgi:predicted nucleic acid-binding protein
VSEAWRAGRLYLDSNALIYFVERADETQAKIAEIIARTISAGETIVISEVGVAECLYGAYKLDSQALEARYNEIFYEIALFDIAQVDGARLKAAARLGAQKGLKLVDALHFVAALEYECTQFLTDDVRIRSSHGIDVVTTASL